MIADFTILSGSTVSNNYTWDIGIPFNSAATTTTAYTTTNYISGYAPGLNVLFRNTSTESTGYDYVEYIWNFGDYYNDTNNVVSLSTFSGAGHLYIMPGKYTVSLTLKQTKLIPYIDPEARTCIGKYDIRWFWNELQCNQLNSLTWNETECASTKPKWWDSEYQCFQKHCKVWNWSELKQSADNPVKWEQTKTETVFEKKWAYEPNTTICSVTDAEFLNTQKTIENTIIKTAIVEVFEIPPKAKLQCLTTSLTGVSPYEVILSPRTSLAGSFPIDRIDWDFNDGSPIKSVSRHTSPDTSIFTFTNAFFDDPKDPRNYNAVYSFRRDTDYSLFYPSITCYSSNTTTKDACSLAVGPILLPSLLDDIKIVKQRNTEKGALYACLANSELFFVVQNLSLSATPVTINTPQNTLINNYTIPNIYFGNPGTNYPSQNNPRPFYLEPDVDFPYIILEDSPEPILTEDNLLIKVQ